MSETKYKGVIGILTGGGDVPGLNPAIRAITLRALSEGYKVIGIRRGWEGLIDMVRDDQADNSANFIVLTEEVVNKIGRTGGTFLHTTRTRPNLVTAENLPLHYRDTYKDSANDLTEEIKKNLEFLNIDYIIPIGGDETLGYAVRLYHEGIKVIGIPKTMDNDVPGTDYCIGYSTCITRIINMTNTLRTSTGSHERILVLEVFGRYSGYTALLPTMAGAANRCVIPEFTFDIEHLTDLLVDDRRKNPSNYSVVLASEGAFFNGAEKLLNTDANLVNRIGGIGDAIAMKIHDLSSKFNKSKPVETISQTLGYLVRSGDPDAIDSIVPMAFGNIAFDLILKGVHGRLVILRNGRYDNMPIDVVTSYKKYVEIDKFYNRDRLRPQFGKFDGKPLFITTGM